MSCWWSCARWQWSEWPPARTARRRRHSRPRARLRSWTAIWRPRSSSTRRSSTGMPPRIAQWPLRRCCASATCIGSWVMARRATRYMRVVREFGDQPAVASEARTQLAALAQSAEVSPFERMLTGEDVGGASLTPDGRLMANVDRDTAGLTVRDIKTGHLTHLVRQEAKQSFGGGPAYLPGSKSPVPVPHGPVISSDGEQIVYAWGPSDGTTTELRLIANRPGATPRTLIRTNEGTQESMAHAW